MPNQDSHDRTVADRLVELRRRRGLTQEALADAAQVSVTVVRKIEQGGTARMETYNALARALRVRTVWFMTSESPPPQVADHRDAVLADIRSAVNPPAGLRGRLFADDDMPPNLPMLNRAVHAVAAAYQADEYDDVARLSPALVRSAHVHVRSLDGDDRDQAKRLRADALQLTGRYLIQVREHDLALIALRDALDDALAAASIGQQGWALMRQARFDEVERLCIDTAEAIEPARMSRASHGDLSAWGYLLMRAAAAAARNARMDEARQYQALANSAAAAVGTEIEAPGHMRFGPVTAAMNGMQNELVGDHPDVALDLARELREGRGKVTPNTMQRHAIDRAKAHVRLRDPDKANRILLQLKVTAPEWLRHQQAARDVSEDIVTAAKRMPSSEQREVAEFLGVPV
jgi:transcriptional regulator with XRE-family HTH domain